MSFLEIRKLIQLRPENLSHQILLAWLNSIKLSDDLQQECNCEEGGSCRMISSRDSQQYRAQFLRVNCGCKYKWKALIFIGPCIIVIVEE